MGNKQTNWEQQVTHVTNQPKLSIPMLICIHTIQLWEGGKFERFLKIVTKICNNINQFDMDGKLFQGIGL